MSDNQIEPKHATLEPLNHTSLIHNQPVDLKLEQEEDVDMQKYDCSNWIFRTSSIINGGV